jgi:hypothetical protein
MQTAKQLSVSLVNKPGRLAAMLAALNKGKVGLRALVVMDTGAQGTIRFVPDDFDAAKRVLESLNVQAEASNVLLVEVPSQPGAFRNICERLAGEHLNIDYAYSSFVGGAKGGALAVVKVNNLVKAQRVLEENGEARPRKKLPMRRPVRARA